MIEAHHRDLYQRKNVCVCVCTEELDGVNDANAFFYRHEYKEKVLRLS